MDNQRFIELFKAEVDNIEVHYKNLSRLDKYSLIEDVCIIEGINVLSLLSKILEWETDSVIRADFVKILGNNPNREIREMLFNGLGDFDARVRANIIEIIAENNSGDLQNLLFPFLDDPSSRVKANVIKALWKFENPRVISTLKWMIKSDDIWMKLSALYVILETRTVLFEKDVLNCLTSNFESVIEKAIIICGEFQFSQSKKRLFELLDQDNEFIVSESITALAKLGFLDAIPRIEDAAGNSSLASHVRLKSIEALGLLKQNSSARVCMGIIGDTKEDEILRLAGLKIFNDLNNKEYNLLLADILLDYMESRTIREYTSFALGELMDQETRNYLENKVCGENRDLVERILKNRTD